jgi:hypothetical protein
MVLKENPKTKFSFQDLADKFNTTPTEIVSMIRAIARNGHGEFRDQVVGEPKLYDKATVLRRRQERRDQRRAKLMAKHADSTFALAM